MAQITKRYAYGEELDAPSIYEMSNNTCHLREEEGKDLTSFQELKLKLLFESYENIFESGRSNICFRAPEQHRELTSHIRILMQNVPCKVGDIEERHY
ncbi:hypothetical protein NPIL_104591 [Nephila pilipes]|uniref:Uncharacterized protein n=1 Tax=Nephila pilipes TaxID=299642 RepID=A0A8X6P6J4_NEPPI|nr:hypothetical protein NPIL_104591 [Nephila pilipes]